MNWRTRSETGMSALIASIFASLHRSRGIRTGTEIGLGLLPMMAQFNALGCFFLGTITLCSCAFVLSRTISIYFRAKEKPRCFVSSLPGEDQRGFDSCDFLSLSKFCDKVKLTRVATNHKHLATHTSSGIRASALLCLRSNEHRRKPMPHGKGRWLPLAVRPLV